MDTIMDTNDLLRQLSCESLQFKIEDIEEKLFEKQKAHTGNPLHKLSIYNLETFLELQRAVPSSTPLPVNEKRLREMEMDIDNYMTVHMPGEEEYKAFIRIVSVYLTFIARKPLHPPGMFNKSGNTLYKGGIAVCPLRAEEITKPGSLCRFCVSTI
ncbi:MAG: DUF2115 family protein [Clostridiales bacterium]|jgi:uncharacterized protein (UPF0305 family)|nr:DUF2115 domain-containing protein [Eubacteriales bacterium]MDH7567918.1 DUF2115 family protein [Clostridiales bacterium]